MNKVDKNLITVILFLSFAIAAMMVVYQMKPTVSKSDIVYGYCNNSRIEDEPKTSEQTCGDLQDFYHVEFLCTDNNKEVGNTCWVEEK